MSWEHEKYEAICSNCGRKGFVIQSSDDWGRFATRYEGFENLEPHPTAVARKRASSESFSPRCPCGSTSVVRGARLSSDKYLRSSAHSFIPEIRKLALKIRNLWFANRFHQSAERF